MTEHKLEQIQPGIFINPVTGVRFANLPTGLRRILLHSATPIYDGLLLDGLVLMDEVYYDAWTKKGWSLQPSGTFREVIDISDDEEEQIAG